MLPLSACLYATAGRAPCTALSPSFPRNDSTNPRRVSYYGWRGPVAKARPGHLVRTTQLDKNATQDVPDARQSVETDVEPLDWNKVWYPVAIESDLNPIAPKPIQLLGRDFVLWNENGEWRCFEDVCPHRLAPLSEGRIEPSDGSLMCSYHGWRFDGGGNCVDIPQVKAKTHEEGSPCKNPRSKVKTFPAKVAGGLVWVWPDGSPSAYIDSSMSEPYYGGIDLESTVTIVPLFTREVPYSIETLGENLMDPSHVPYAHNGIQGSRDRAGYFEGKMEKVPEDSKATFRTFMASVLLPKKKNNRAPEEGKGESVVKRVVEFFEPTAVVYGAMMEGRMVFLMTPNSAEKSTIFFRAVVPSLPWFVKLMLKVTRPKWRAHLENNEVLDGDTVLLRAQGRTLRKAAQQGKKGDSNFFVPSSADVMIVKFRKWFHGKRGGGGPKLPNGDLLSSGLLETQLNKEEVLDRYHSHTKHCKACSGAMRNFGILEKCASVVAAGLSVSMLMMVQALSKSGGAGAGPIGKVVCVGLGALVALFVSFKSKQMKQKFVYTGYEHWAR
ncbi:hypothetical protein BSKO_09228 [Bryopsis sp. KO-2023]|nr:hypothetical protein BSKO_09228 [Bryopsis sp. KO-2023]